MIATERLDEFQQRHRWAGLPLAIVYKFHDDQGTYLAALIAYYGFLSLFPLLLLLTSTLGFVLQSHPDLQQRVLDSTLSQFPVIGDQLGDPQGLRGNRRRPRRSARLVAVYGALGVAHAVQNTMNVTWAVPRCRRPNPFRLRLRSLLPDRPRSGRRRGHHRAVGARRIERHGVRRRPRMAEHVRSSIVAVVARQRRGVRRRLLDLRRPRKGSSSRPLARRARSPPSSGSCCSWAGRRTSATSSRAPRPRTACSPSCSGCSPGSSSPPSRS